MTLRRFPPLLALVLLLAACTTTIHDPHRLERTSAVADSLGFIWSAAEPPKFSNLPALGASMIGTPAATYWARYDSEFAAFGDSLRSQLAAVPELAPATLVALPAGHAAADLQAQIGAAPKTAALVVMHPDFVTAYCTAGCYSFRIRVDYLAPVTRKRVWTAIVDVPPKAAQRDSFDPRALDFLRVVARQLDKDRLLAGAAPNAAAPATAARTHRKQVPAATGFAQAGDDAAVPVKPEGRPRYLHYLTLPAPKAFAVSAGGNWRFYANDPDAMFKALERCQREGATCWLYAVDDQVVWDAAPDKRLGRAEQLLDRP